MKAQVDYIRERVPGAEIHIHPHSGEAGAIGAAIETLRVVKRSGRSTFIGLDAAINLDYVTRNDESTRCHFCPNLCSRTFIDSVRPDGETSRYISGFSCERGTVESKDVMLNLVRERKELKQKYVNLLEYEGRVAFRSFYKPRALPDNKSVTFSAAGELIDGKPEEIDQYLVYYIDRGDGRIETLTPAEFCKLLPEK